MKDPQSNIRRGTTRIPVEINKRALRQRQLKDALRKRAKLPNFASTQSQDAVMPAPQSSIVSSPDSTVAPLAHQANSNSAPSDAASPLPPPPPKHANLPDNAAHPLYDKKRLKAFQRLIASEHGRDDHETWVREKRADELADRLQRYCQEIADLNLGNGKMRSRNGPRQLNYVLLKDIYELGWQSVENPLSKRATFSNSRKFNKLFLKMLQAARIRLRDQVIAPNILTPQKLSSWSRVCTEMLLRKTTPDQFIDALISLGGLDSVRRLSAKKRRTKSQFIEPQ